MQTEEKTASKNNECNRAAVANDKNKEKIDESKQGKTEKRKILEKELKQRMQG